MPTRFSLGESVFRHPWNAQNLRFVSPSEIVSVGFDGWFRLWDFRNGKMLGQWFDEKEELYDADKINDDTYVCAGLTGTVNVLRHDEPIRTIHKVSVPGFVNKLRHVPWLNGVLVGCSTGELLLVLSHGNGKPTKLLEADDTIVTLQTLHHSHDVFVASASGELWIIDENGNAVELPRAAIRISHAACDAAKRRVWLLDKKPFEGNQYARLIEIQDTRLWELKTLKLPAARAEACMALNSASDSIQIGVEESILTCDPSTLTVQHTKTTRRQALRIEFSLDDQHLAVAEAGCLFQVFDSALNELFPATTHSEKVCDVGFLAETKVYSHALKPRITFWDSTTGRRTDSSTAKAITMINAFPLDRDKFVGTFFNGSSQTTMAWIPKTGEVLWNVDSPSQSNVEMIRRLRQRVIIIWDDDLFSPSGEVDGLDPENGKRLFELSHGEVKIRAVVSGADVIACLGDDHVWLWNPRTLKLFSELTLPCCSRGQFAFMTGSDQIVVVAENEMVSLNWRTEQWTTVIKLPGTVGSSCLSEPSDRLGLGFDAGTVEIREPHHPFRLLTDWAAHSPSGVSALAFDRAGTRLVTGARDGTLALWSDLLTTPNG